MLLRKIWKSLWKTTAWICWRELVNEGCELSPRIILKHWFIQKVLRINSHVPWPVHFTTRVMCPNRIRRGDRSPGLSSGCHLDGRNGIKIGKNVWIGPRVSLISMNHDTQDYSKYVEANSIVIGDNCWLATNSIILPEVVLGEHTIVAAGAVVNQSFEDGNVVLAGIPAKVVKRLPPYLTRDSDWSPAGPNAE